MGLKRFGFRAQPALDDSAHEVKPAPGRIVLVPEPGVRGTRRKAKPTVHTRLELVFLRPKRGGQRSVLLRLHCGDVPLLRIPAGSNAAWMPEVNRAAGPSAPHAETAPTISGGP